MQKLPKDVLSHIFDHLVEPLDTHVRLRGGDSGSPSRPRQLSQLYLSRLCLVSRQFNQVASAKLFGHWLIVIDKPSKLKEVIKSDRVMSNAAHLLLKEREPPSLAQKNPPKATPKQILQVLTRCSRLQSLQLELVSVAGIPNNEVVKALVKAQWTSTAWQFKLSCPRLSSREMQQLIKRFPNLTSLALRVLNQTDQSKVTPLNLPGLRTFMLYGLPKDTLYEELNRLFDKATLQGLRWLSCPGFDIVKDKHAGAETFPQLRHLALRSVNNPKWNVDMGRLSRLPNLRTLHVHHPQGHPQQVSFKQVLELLPSSTEYLFFQHLNAAHVAADEFKAPLNLDGKKLSKVQILCDASQHPIHHDSDCFDSYMFYVRDLAEIKGSIIRSLNRAGVRTAFEWIGHPAFEEEEDEYY